MTLHFRKLSAVRVDGGTLLQPASTTWPAATDSQLPQ